MVWSVWEGYCFSVYYRIRPSFCWAQLHGLVLNLHPPLKQSVWSLLWLLVSWLLVLQWITKYLPCSGWLLRIKPCCVATSMYILRLLSAVKPATAVLLVHLDRRGILPKWLFFLKSFPVFLFPLLATCNRSRFHEVLIQTLNSFDEWSTFQNIIATIISV